VKSEFLHYSDLLKWLDARDANSQPVPFTMKYVKADRKRRIGGAEVNVPQAVLYTMPRQSKAASVATGATLKKPNHYDHDTVNIMLLPSRLIRKVHTRLITEFNNQPVYY
jgi:hypothetical protein